MKKIEPSQEELKRLFQYKDDALYWNIDKPQAGIKIGMKAGYIEKSCKYWTVKINSVSYLQHRLIYIINFRAIPEGMFIDHADMNRTNNKLDNLRLCNRSQNNSNKKKQKNNTSKYKGVSLENSKWLARIQVNKNKIRIGIFENILDAHEAYKVNAIKYHGEFANFD